MTVFPIRALLIGPVQPFGPRGVPSGIAKSPVVGPVALGIGGLNGDAQGDLRHHGGPDKAVHHYAFDHYATWQAEIGARDVLEAPGAFGENISTLGLTEDMVSIGDVFAIGGAILEVSQGRQPCWKLNERFCFPAMSKRVQESGRTGWYYRVLQSGDVAPGDCLERIERRSSEWTIRRLWRAFYVDTLNRVELEGIVDLPGLADNWRAHARRRLDINSVEDWSLRLTGPQG